MSLAAMQDCSLVLDLTRSTRGAQDTLEACRQLTDCRWELLVAHAEVDGLRAARDLAAADPRARAIRVGSGTGDCDWATAVAQTRGRYVAFLHPGDRLVPDAVTRWMHTLSARGTARWVLGAADGAPHNAGWFQRSMAPSAAALLLAGAAFPECSALVARDAWLDVADRFPETTQDASRATAWLALALLTPPLAIRQVVAVTQTMPVQPDMDMLGRVLEGAARRDPTSISRLSTDVARLAAGLRVGWRLFEGALEASWRSLGAPSAEAVHPEDWAQRWSFLEAMLARGDRAIWIWGAGQLGLEALEWLQAHSVPVEGFLDRDVARDGTQWADLPVRQGDVVAARAAGRAAPLIVVASMYHADITADLLAYGLRPGVDVVVYARGRRPRVEGDAFP